VESRPSECAGTLFYGSSSHNQPNHRSEIQWTHPEWLGEVEEEEQERWNRGHRNVQEHCSMVVSSGRAIAYVRLKKWLGRESWCGWGKTSHSSELWCVGGFGVGEEDWMRNSLMADPEDPEQRHSVMLKNMSWVEESTLVIPQYARRRQRGRRRLDAKFTYGGSENPVQRYAVMLKNMSWAEESTLVIPQYASEREKKIGCEIHLWRIGRILKSDYFGTPISISSVRLML
jgi:hypothetical protein